MFQGMFRMQSCILRTVSVALRREMTTGKNKVDKTLLSKLRKKTGFPFINCRKALDQFDNDIQQAEKWLRDEAQKEGWAKATKLQSRAMSQGLVGLVGNSQAVTMVEVNCETDFVARNKKFASLVSSLTLACREHFTKLSDKKITLDSAALGKIGTSEGQTLSDLVALQVGNIGENMALRRAVHLRADQQTFLTSYVHASGVEMKIHPDCQLGKFGSILEVSELPLEVVPKNISNSASSGETADVSSEDDEPISMDELCRHLAQHIVGMNPKRVGDPNVDEPKRKKPVPAVGETGAETNKTSGTAAEDLKDADQIGGDANVNASAEGEDSGTGQDGGIKQDRIEEDLLIFQEYLLDPSVSVGELLQSNHIAVEDFVRFECGEDLGEESS